MDPTWAFGEHEVSYIYTDVVHTWTGMCPLVNVTSGNYESGAPT